MKKPSPKRSQEAALQQSWQDLEPRLRKAAWQTPQKGFAARWQANWQQEQARRRKLRNQWLLAANGLVLLLLIAAAALALWQLLSQPAAAFSATVAYLAQVAGLVWTLLRVLTSMLSLVPLPVWLAASAGSLGLLILWVLLYRQTPYKELG